MRVLVKLNGTEVNPYQKMGLRRNPFPQIAKTEHWRLDAVLADLEARPIKSTEDLLERITDAADWFQDLCLEHYKPGEVTQFEFELDIN